MQKDLFAIICIERIKQQPKEEPKEETKDMQLKTKSTKELKENKHN